ncbi:MAG TPA: aminotransferase class V-fold PLP-dependent enzyme [Phycisphaerales bacterium]|nr:aminotransferase class V-fold PLP-dependent enzyme [Phycisphaerales bacterium]
MAVTVATHEIAPPAPFEGIERSEWLLDPEYHFLNHGSFGARTRTVLAAQMKYREAFEARPIEFLGRKFEGMLGQVKERVGELLGAQGKDLAMMTNATEGVNAVLRSLKFEPGDELLTTNHVYNAVRQTMNVLANRAGAKAVEVNVPVPVRGPQDVVRAIEGAITERTKLIVVDHVTSPTALVFPVKEIIELAAKRGIDVLVDGAHAPGMLDVKIEELAPAYYAGNLHKWVCAPPGSAFLWVRRDKQAGILPPTISHHCMEGFERAFGWQGTRDVSSWLAVTDAIGFLEQHSLTKIRAHNHTMATWVQAMLCERWGVEASSPLDGQMLGSMATVRLPEGVRKFGKAEALQAEIYSRHKIEVPVVDWSGAWWVRPCCQVYNRPEHYELLGDAVKHLAS